MNVTSFTDINTVRIVITLVIVMCSSIRNDELFIIALLLTPANSIFVITRGLIWDETHNFEPRSEEEDDTRAGTPHPNFHTTPTEGRLATTYDLTCSRTAYTADLQWNRVLNLEPSGPEAETRTPRPLRCFAIHSTFFEKKKDAKS
ncbi:hypothetical protein AVEN_133020-1 [Araneus ventricosus]|uniref:Uncharacterized protein n=1 Tax=Araneus ventricosus TaxID=182803 RepID=A0A4Y2LM01_ARAVE|nr:hypothetical protein AVEN_133020-1 [Araneus ventricosus]